MIQYSGLIRRGGFWILDLQLVDDLLNIGNFGGDCLGLFLFIFRVNATGKSYDAILHVILYVFIQSGLYERGVQIFVDTFIQVGIHRPGCAFVARGNDSDFVGDNLAARIGLGDRFGL